MGRDPDDTRRATSWTLFILLAATFVATNTASRMPLNTHLIANLPSEVHMLAGMTARELLEQEPVPKQNHPAYTGP